MMDEQTIQEIAQCVADIIQRNVTPIYDKPLYS